MLIYEERSTGLLWGFESLDVLIEQFIRIKAVRVSLLGTDFGTKGQSLTIMD